METLIKFRLLAAQLNEQEMPIFLTKLINTPHIYQLIISSIFNHFAGHIIKSKPPFNSNQINDITNIISQLIESRIYKPNKIDIDDEPLALTQQPNDTPTIKMDHFAPELLSVISSFLPQKDYISFQISNRKILIGCNSPCALQTYYCSCYRNPTTININKCSSMKHLSIDTSSNTKRDRLNVVQTIKNLLANPNINFNSITTFSCGSFGEHSAENCRLFNVLLSKFINLQYLNMVDVVATDWRTTSDAYVPPSFPQLKGISFILNDRLGNSAYRKLMEVYSNQIVSFCCSSSVISLCQTYKFSKLKELKVEIKEHRYFQPFIKNTNSLEIVSMQYDDTNNRWNFGATPSKKQKIEEIKLMINELFKTQQKLKYFEINAKQKWFQGIIGAICDALNNSMKVKRDAMKLQIILRDNRKDNSIDWVDVLSSVMDVLNILNDCDINNWMFGFKYIRKHNDVLFDERDKRLGYYKDKYLVNYYQQDKKFKLVISNKENHMNGGYSPHGVYVY